MEEEGHTIISKGTKNIKYYVKEQVTLDSVKEEYNKKFEQKAKSEKKLFSFDDMIQPLEAQEGSNSEIE